MIAETDDLPILLPLAFALPRSTNLGGAGERRHVRPGHNRPRRIRPARPTIPAWRASLGWRRPAARIAARAIIGSRGAAHSASLSLVVFEFGLVNPGDDAQWDLLADQLDDRRDGSAIFGRRQHEGPTKPAGAGGATDAVDVILGVDWHVKAEDVTQALDVQAAGRDIAGDQQPDLTLSEALQGLRPFRLRHVAVQRRGIEAVSGE